MAQQKTTTLTLGRPHQNRTPAPACFSRTSSCCSRQRRVPELRQYGARGERICFTLQNPRQKRSHSTTRCRQRDIGRLHPNRSPRPDSRDPIAAARRTTPRCASAAHVTAASATAMEPPPPPSACVGRSKVACTSGAHRQVGQLATKPSDSSAVSRRVEGSGAPRYFCRRYRLA